MHLKPVSKIIHINRNTDPGSETNLSGIPNEHTGHHIRGFTTELHKGYNTPQDSRQDSGISCWSQIHKVQRQPIQQDHKPTIHVKNHSTTWRYHQANGRPGPCCGLGLNNIWKSHNPTSNREQRHLHRPLVLREKTLATEMEPKKHPTKAPTINHHHQANHCQVAPLQTQTYSNLESVQMRYKDKITCLFLERLRESDDGRRFWHMEGTRQHKVNLNKQ